MEVCDRGAHGVTGTGNRRVDSVRESGDGGANRMTRSGDEGTGGRKEYCRAGRRGRGRGAGGEGQGGGRNRAGGLGTAGGGNRVGGVGPEEEVVMGGDRPAGAGTRAPFCLRHSRRELARLVPAIRCRSSWEPLLAPYISRTA